MKNKIFYTMGTLMIGSVMFIGTSAFAEENTYTYIDVNGKVRVELASNAQEALDEAVMRHPNSGVQEIELVAPTIATEADINDELYMYITIDDKTGFVIADSPSEAIREAKNRAANSGVMVVAS